MDGREWVRDFGHSTNTCVKALAGTLEISGERNKLLLSETLHSN